MTHLFPLLSILLAFLVLKSVLLLLLLAQLEKDLLQGGHAHSVAIHAQDVAFIEKVGGVFVLLLLVPRLLLLLAQGDIGLDGGEEIGEPDKRTVKLLPTYLTYGSTTPRTYVDSI